jgi:hypothetical protein
MMKLTMFEKYRQRRREERRRQALASIRIMFAECGHNTSDMSDEEVEQLLIECDRRFRKVGLRAAEAGKALGEFASAISKIPTTRVSIT